jgi:excisionase family DNA binding protein
MATSSNGSSVTAAAQRRLNFPDGLVEQIAQRVAQLMRADNGHAEASPWLTFEQACAYLGFTQDELYKLTAARAIPMRKKAGGQGLVFHRDELDRWMDAAYPRLDRLP